MEKKLLSGKQIVMWICLLISVGILCISKNTVYASQSESTGLGSTLDPSQAEEYQNQADEYQNQINIANELTVSVNNGNGELNGSLRILLTLTLIAIAPLLLMVMTSYTRIIIVLHFTRAALNTQTAPTNQILIGLALILTFFIMEPTIDRVYNEAIIPFEEGELDQKEALDKAMVPIREFMYGSTQQKDVSLFMEIAGLEWDTDASYDETIPTSVLVPSFIISELRKAFAIGFIIYIPFIVIDMVVASTLMSMGMMMLPPTTISMPFKILLFVLADGWGLIIGVLVRTFY